MTAKTDLLPLPEWCSGCGESLPRDMQNYARANVAHATAAKDADIERLEEALRLIVEEVDDLLASHPKATTYPDGPCIEKQSRSTLADARDKARAALEREEYQK